MLEKLMLRRKWGGVLLLSSMCVSSLAGAQVHLGFRGAVLGQPPLPEMKMLEKWRPFGTSSREISDAYSRPDESLELGDLKIREVVYEYFDQQLFKIEVDLWVPGQERCPKVDELKSAIESQYGITMRVHQADYVRPSFMLQWRGPESWITYLCQPFMEINTLTYQATRLAEKVQASVSQSAAEKARQSAERMRKGM